MADLTDRIKEWMDDAYRAYAEDTAQNYEVALDLIRKAIDTLPRAELITKNKEDNKGVLSEWSKLLKLCTTEPYRSMIREQNHARDAAREKRVSAVTEDEKQNFSNDTRMGLDLLESGYEALRAGKVEEGTMMILRARCALIDAREATTQGSIEYDVITSNLVSSFHTLERDVCKEAQKRIPMSERPKCKKRRGKKKASEAGKLHIKLEKALQIKAELDGRVVTSRIGNENK